MITLVTGDLGAGKSTFCQYFGALLLEESKSVVGIISTYLPIYGSDEHGYGALFLPAQVTKDFIYPTELLTGKNAVETDASAHDSDGKALAFQRTEQFRKYSFDAEVLSAGTKLIINTLTTQKELPFFILDEVGVFELEGGGWAKVMDILSNTPNCHALISVRKSAIDSIKKRWNLEDSPTIDISPTVHLSSEKRSKKHNCCAPVIPKSWVVKADGIMQTL